MSEYFGHRQIGEMIEYYERTASKYDEWHLKADDRAIVNYLLKHVKGRALDVCTGTGRILKELLMAGFDAYGIDISQALLQKAVEKGIPKYRLFLGDATNMKQLADRSFDTSVVFGSLHHTPFPKRVVAEMIRVTKQDIFIRDSSWHLRGYFKYRIKLLLFKLKLLNIARRITKRKLALMPEKRIHYLDGDGPRFKFVVDEVIPILRQNGHIVRVINEGYKCLRRRGRFWRFVNRFLIEILPYKITDSVLVHAKRKS